MSTKIALVAAATLATAAQANFCATLGGINICREEVDMALESQKINITGCLEIKGVKVCKNEETSVFDEDSEQGFCLEVKGIKVCNEQVEAALESQKIDITGCVKIGQVEICKNEETEQGLGKVFKKVVKVAKVVGPFVLDEDAEDAAVAESDEQGWKGWKKIGKIAKIVGPMLLEEDAELETDEQKWKGWKKIEKALKKIHGSVGLGPLNLTFEDEAEVAEAAWKGWKKIGNVIKKIVEVVPITIALEEEEEVEAAWKGWKRIGKALKKIHGSIGLGPVNIAFEDEEEQKWKGWRRIEKAVKKIIEVVPISIALDEEASAHTKPTKPHFHGRRNHTRTTKPHFPGRRNHTRTTKPARKVNHFKKRPTKQAPIALEEEQMMLPFPIPTFPTFPPIRPYDEEQGFCLEVKGIKICKEQIEAALESQKINITGCVTVAGVSVCKNEETSVFDEDAEQGFCVEWNGIKVCKEQVEAALESQKINITGCVKIGKVEVCKNESTDF